MFRGLDYIKLPRNLKSSAIWGKILSDVRPGEWHLDKALTVDQSLVFDTPGDELECVYDGQQCRKKTLHSQGSVAQMQWVSLGNHPYTGMFKGGDTGFIRLSVAAPVDK